MWTKLPTHTTPSPYIHLNIFFCWEEFWCGVQFAIYGEVRESSLLFSALAQGVYLHGDIIEQGGTMPPLQGAYIKEVRLTPTLPIRLPWLAAVSWLVSACSPNFATSPIPVPSAWCRFEPAFSGHCLNAAISLLWSILLVPIALFLHKS